MTRSRWPEGIAQIRAQKITGSEKLTTQTRRTLKPATRGTKRADLGGEKIRQAS